MASPKYSAERFKRYENVFDERTIKFLFKLSSEGYFEGLAEPVALGKEANVFVGEQEDGHKVIVKIYRVENSNFNNMAYYIAGDPRFDTIVNHRRKIVKAWVQREYRNLLLARDYLRVPTPYAFRENVLVMEHIGEHRPAPQLKDVDLQDPERFWRHTKRSIKKLLDAGLVHGDLSQFNILYNRNKPVFIDMGQSTPITSTKSQDLFERDIKNITKFFKRHIDVNKEKEELHKLFLQKREEQR